MKRETLMPKLSPRIAALFFVLILTLLSQTAKTVAADKPNKAKRPNILFVYTDDHSYRTVSCYPQAYPWAKTPTIDRLAREGMRFESAYIGTWCMPSRATLLTGHHQFGVESMRMEGDYPGSKYDPQKCPFWPAEARKQGYTTAQIGKWHTGTDTGYGRDWDFQIVWNRPAHPENHQNYYYDQPVTYQGGETKILKRYSTDQYTDWAVDYIGGKGRDTNKPWYLWLCYDAVHSPFTPADRHRKDYAGIDVPTPKDIFPPRPGKPDWAQKIKFWEKGADGSALWQNRTLASWVRQYHQGVLAIDEGLKKLLTTLEKTGQRENTLIIFTSDQGHAWGQHGFRTKIAAYDANIRSPLIISMPGRIPEGTVCETPVGGVDLVPTIHAFAGLDLPWKMHGRDLSPLLKDPKTDWPHPVLLTATGRKYGSDTNTIPKGKDVYHGKIPWYVMLRDKNYKYARPLNGNDLEELYDMKQDPDELDNLAVKPRFRNTLVRLRLAAIAELQRNGAGFVANLPPVREVVPQ
jgi:arylsulfatase A-like enzyme